MHRYLSVAAVLFGSIALPAADWPQFRGPTGDGHYEGAKIPIEWGPDKNVVWKKAMPGHGWSSPIVWKGKIYLTTAVEKSGNYSLQALCVDAKTGIINWQKEVFLESSATAPKIHNKNSHASATPITDGERVYVHFGHMGTAALDLKGTVLWKNNKLSYKPIHGNGGSPILVDDKLVFSCDGSDSQIVAALNKKTGEIAWKTDRKSTPAHGFSFGTPLLVTVNGKPQIVSPASDIIAGYDPAKGTEIWRIKTKGYSLIPRPVFGNGLVYFSTGYDSPSLMAVKPEGTGDLTSSNIEWTVRTAPHTPSPLLAGDEIYMVSDKGLASCVNAKNGEVLWSERVQGEYSASPIYHDGKIFLTAEQGQGTVLAAGKEFKILKENDLKERTFASFAVVDGALFVRTEKTLYRFQQK